MCDKGVRGHVAMFTLTLDNGSVTPVMPQCCAFAAFALPLPVTWCKGRFAHLGLTFMSECVVMYCKRWSYLG